MGGILERIRKIREDNSYNRAILNEIADDMEEIIGEEGMWKTLRPGFSTDELLENLEYIAKEEDL